MCLQGYVVVTDITPSYFAKVNWAEKHVPDLEREINTYIESHPYGVDVGVENKQQVWRLRVDQPSNSPIPIIAGSIIYNLHSALDHMACALVPSAGRGNVSFPIFWKGVWERPPEFEWGLPVPCEHTQRLQDRQRWHGITRKMHPDAVAILKALQPDDAGGDQVNSLRVIKALANKDRHSQLPVVSTGIRNVTMRFHLSDGTEFLNTDHRTLSNTVLVKNGAHVETPPNTVEVDVVGTPSVAVRFGQEEADLDLLVLVRDKIPIIRKILTDLSPFLHVSGAKSKPKAKKARKKTPHH
jgi:hypothetical protein